MKTNKIFQIALAVVIVGLAVLLYNSIMKPVRFDNEYNQRRDAVVVKLKEIRNLQEAYKMTYGCLAAARRTDKSKYIALLDANRAEVCEGHKVSTIAQIYGIVVCA